jgi:hypothetical protein
MLRTKVSLLGLAALAASLAIAGPAQADHWRIRPRTVVGFSVSFGAPVVVAPPPVVVGSPVVVYDPYAPVVVRPAPVIVVDPWYPPPTYYYRSATGVYIGPGFGFYYERWR